jgi:hypothetical protein
MADVSLEWGGDFQIDYSGDLVISDGDTEVRQRIERRLFTAVNGYVWYLNYGAGLPQKIGSTLSVSLIQSIVASQLALEKTVAANPPAQLTVTGAAGGFVNIAIKYWDNTSGVAVSFQITA